MAAKLWRDASHERAEPKRLSGAVEVRKGVPGGELGTGYWSREPWGGSSWWERGVMMGYWVVSGCLMSSSSDHHRRYSMP